MTYRRGFLLLLFVAGSALLLGGLAGFGSLYSASRQYERTVGTVKRVDTKRVYRARKFRYDSRMLVSYPTRCYGELTAYISSYCPMRREGDRVVVWYHPDRPRDIRRPRAECCVWGIMFIAGLLCVCCGAAVRSAEKTNLTNKPK